jgi:hypothetical protein
MTDPRLLPIERVTQQVRLLARDLGSSWRGVKGGMIDAADALRALTHQHEAPIDPDPILRFRRVLKTWFASTSSPMAMLLPTNGGFTLRLRPGMHPLRLRFTLAHELAHTFFYNTELDPPRKLISISRETVPYQKQEDICNAFAAALLLPADLVRPYLDESQTRGLSKWDILASTGSKFGVSTEVAVRRLLSDFEGFEHCVAIFATSSREAKTSVRYWRGRALKNCRVGESMLLDSLTQALDASTETDLGGRLKSIESGARNMAAVNWRLTPFQNGNFALTMLVDFSGSRRQTRGQDDKVGGGRDAA